MNNRFVLILAVIAIGFIGLVVFTKKDAGAPASGVEPTSHTLGTGTVTLVEYGDFECPGCGQYYPVLKEVKDKYGDQITFQYRHYPLVSIHPNAMVAHRAAEAAAQQGKFWEMHDILFENQGSWSAQAGASQEQAYNIMENFAEQLNLNIEQFNTDRNSAAINDIIQADISAGQDLKVTGTPSFFLNGEKLEETVPTVEYFSGVIDPLLNNGE